MRAVAVPHAICYSFSGAKILDIAHHIPSIIEKYPSIHIAVAQAGVNYIRSSKKSAETQRSFRHLAQVIENLGKCCVSSGPLPLLHCSSERFSRLFQLDKWLISFTKDKGYGYVTHFDSFWNQEFLYRHDELHPNQRGIKVLAHNLSRHLDRHNF